MTNLMFAGSHRLALACVLLMALAVAPLRAQSFQDLFDFNCNTGGCGPIDYGQLTQGPDGNLYGTANGGGANNVGTIFMVTPLGGYTDLYSFDWVHGAGPNSGLTLASDGNFYGATIGGGTFSSGTLFRLTPCNTPPCPLTVLHNFNGTDGQQPVMPPTEVNVAGIHYLYGLANSSSFSNSPAYRVTLPAGTFKSLSSSAPGATSGPLLLASDGNLYGTTLIAMTGNGSDTLFRMTTAGAITVIHTFKGVGVDGATPLAPLTQGRDGLLYGTTEYGVPTGSPGEVFVSTLKGALLVLYSFNPNGSDGAYPNGGGGVLAASDGFFYGATEGGGNVCPCGTIFQITNNGTFNKLFDFTGQTGAVPGSAASATLMEHTNGSFYGLTRSGGSAGNGNFYSVAPLNLSQILTVAGPIFLLPGVPVEILGNNLTHVIGLTFGGVPAQPQGGSNTFLIATVPMAAVDGVIAATYDSGLQVETQSAMHILPLITNLDPTSGPVGTPVGIVGGGLMGATKVTFGGVKARQFTVVNPTLIQAIVPVGAKTGKVTVTTPNGTAKSKQTFTVT